MMQGFRLLTERGVGGGRLINMVIKYRAPKMVPARRGSTAAEKAEATAASDPGGLGIVSLHSHAKSHGKVMELVVVGEVRPGGEAELVSHFKKIVLLWKHEKTDAISCIFSVMPYWNARYRRASRQETGYTTGSESPRLRGWLLWWSGGI